MNLPLNILRFLLVALAAMSVTPLPASPVISEFMASNSLTLQDDEGNFSDWIEIHNPSSSAADLTGWFLTDSATNIDR